MSSRKLRIGMIACGDIAGFAGLCFRMNPSVELVACCDSNLDRAQDFARKHNIAKVSPDYQTLIMGNLLDGVYIATPHFLHYDMITCAIKAGVAVLCEKPVTTRLEDAQTIKVLAKQSGVKVGVNYQYRYDLAINRLHQLAHEGVIGRILFVRLNIPWHREASYLTGWRNDKIKAGGGTLLTQGSHAIDFSQWICGSNPKQAIGFIRNRVFNSPVEDLAMGEIELENGVLIQISSTMVANPEKGLSAEFYTSKGTVVYQNKPFPRLSSNQWLYPDLGLFRKGVFALQRSVNGFVDWLLEKDTHLIPVSESIPALASVLALYQSSASARTMVVQV